MDKNTLMLRPALEKQPNSLLWYGDFEDLLEGMVIWYSHLELKRVYVILYYLL